MPTAAGAFEDELAETAAKLSSSGKGILAADESTGTIGKRLASIGLENSLQNRQELRELLFTTPGIEEFISGVVRREPIIQILFEETLDQETKDGIPFAKLLQEKGIIPGIKVDKGVVVLPGTSETTTQGLDGLSERCANYYQKGARFAKWRAVLKIGNGMPSQQAIEDNAHGLARYAAICQSNGLVPIVEPEILSDGTHTIEECAAITQNVISHCYKALNDHKVFLEGTLLKPNMVLPGTDSSKVDPQVVAVMTMNVLRRTVPPSVPGINFLSGGQSEEEATMHLNEMNKLPGKKPWSVSFSYGRALQASTLKTWKGKPENIAAAQSVFYERCKANGMATLGRFEGGEARGESLHVKNYAY